MQNCRSSLNQIKDKFTDLASRLANNLDSSSATEVLPDNYVLMHVFLRVSDEFCDFFAKFDEFFSEFRRQIQKMTEFHLNLSTF